MAVTHYYLIGNATIPSSWVALILGFIVAYIAVRFRYGKHVSDLLVDGIFYFILIWKLSVIITQFGIVIKSPLTILYFNGGRAGVMLGLLGAAFKIGLTLKKSDSKQQHAEALFVGVVIIQAVYQIVMVVVNEATLLIQISTIASFLVFTLFVWILVGKGKYSPIQLPVLFIAVHFFVAAFQSVSIFGTMTTVLISLFFMLMTYHQKGFEPEGTV